MFVNVQITVMIYLTLLVFLVFVLLFPPINCLSYFFLQSLGQLVKCITQKKIQYSVNFILILLSSLQNRKLYFKQSVQRFLSVLPKFIKLWYCTYSYNIKKDSYIDSNIDDFFKHSGKNECRSYFKIVHCIRYHSNAKNNLQMYLYLLFIFLILNNSLQYKKV